MYGVVNVAAVDGYTVGVNKRFTFGFCSMAVLQAPVLAKRKYNGSSTDESRSVHIVFFYS